MPDNVGCQNCQTGCKWKQKQEKWQRNDNVGQHWLSKLRNWLQIETEIDKMATKQKQNDNKDNAAPLFLDTKI